MGYSLSFLVDAPGWVNVHRTKSALYILQRRTLSAKCHRKTSGHPLWALWWACLTSTKSTKESPNQVDFLSQMFGTGKVVLPNPNKIQNFIQMKKAEKCQIPLRWANMFFLDLHDFFVWEIFCKAAFCSRWTEVNRTRSLVNTHGNNLELRPKISSTLKFRSHVLLRCILTSIVFVLLCMVPCANERWYKEVFA